MSKYSVTRKLKFDAGHRVMRHESKCSHLHGHEYRVEVTCTADQLDSVGRVVDFSVIKEKLGTWIDENWDHGTLVNELDTPLIEWLEANEQKHYVFTDYGRGCEPTAENIAHELFKKAHELFDGTPVIPVRVRVWETTNCAADYPADLPARSIS